jgi:hypothetical protein
MRVHGLKSGEVQNAGYEHGHSSLHEQQGYIGTYIATKMSYALHLRWISVIYSTMSQPRPQIRPHPRPPLLYISQLHRLFLLSIQTSRRKLQLLQILSQKK